MPRTPDEKYRRAKQNKILDGAHTVFCRKGFLAVTMQDIIDECKISRGGIYLYFSSVEELFREVSSRRNKAKFSIIRKAVDDNEPFMTVLDDYIALQKERLLHMENSLLRAMYEYIFSRADGATQVFREAQLSSIRQSVSSILLLGVRQGVIRNDQIQRLTDHFVVTIEGLGVLALSEVITEKIVDEQFTILADMVERMKEER